MANTADTTVIQKNDETKEATKATETIQSAEKPVAETEIVTTTTTTTPPTTEPPQKQNKDAKRGFILGVVLTLLVNLLCIVAWYLFNISKKNDVPSIPEIKQSF